MILCAAWPPAVWVLSVLGLEFTMDVGFYGGRGVYDPLMAAFEAAYKGNRAPVPIFVHTTWVQKDPSRLEELKQFAGGRRGWVPGAGSDWAVACLCMWG